MGMDVRKRPDPNKRPKKLSLKKTPSASQKARGYVINNINNIKQLIARRKKKVEANNTGEATKRIFHPKSVDASIRPSKAPAAGVPYQHTKVEGKLARTASDSKSKLARHDSISHLTRLKRDGRKIPEEYRMRVLRAPSPSQISIRSITEYYDCPSQDFPTLDDVFAYRGYKKIGKLDEGAFGVVYKAVRLGDNYPVALKEVDLSKRRSKRIDEMKRELFVLQKVNSPFIVHLVEHFISGQTLVIIMELCAGSNMTNYLKEAAIQEEEARHLFRQMASGLRLMHRKGIAHRDVKLNNFLLDGSRKNVKVADFGLSIVSYKRDNGLLMCKTYCGTEPYMAPEIVRRTTKGLRQYNPLYADVWALGVCLYAMLTRTFPFKQNLSQGGLFRSQQERRWRFPRTLRDNLSEELKDIMWHMLDPDPDRRISINGVVSHPWLNPDLFHLSQEES